MYLLENGLTKEEAKEREKFYIKDYLNKGYTLLNTFTYTPGCMQGSNKQTVLKKNSLDDNNALYKVYYFVIDNEYYVGRTKNSLLHRLGQHIQGALTSKSSSKVYKKL